MSLWTENFCADFQAKKVSSKPPNIKTAEDLILSVNSQSDSMFYISHISLTLK